MQLSVYMAANERLGRVTGRVEAFRTLGWHPILVYDRCMPRTNVNIDDEACAEVMRRYRLKTKREAVNFALRALAAEPFGVDEARRLRGSGWEGDLGELRTSRST